MSRQALLEQLDNAWERWRKADSKDKVSIEVEIARLHKSLAVLALMSNV